MVLTKAYDIHSRIIQAAPEAPTWKAAYPNPADFNFNYNRLLRESPAGIGQAPKNADKYRIAVVGAGIAGITATRELVRSGYKNVDLFEATGRLAGRHYTIGSKTSTDTVTQYTPFEMAAMRMPFFADKTSNNSILGYYRELFDIATQDFPNPGSKIADTGIYVDEGLSEGGDPKLLIWKKTDAEPPTAKLETVHKKWKHFADMATAEIAKHYTTPDWPDFWKAFVQNYYNKSFRDLALLKDITKYDPAHKAYFGGLGLTEEESSIFYSIGAGDGSWGAFYGISCLYPLRTFLFGFGSNLQLIQGLFKNKEYKPGPHAHEKDLKDSIGNPIEAPTYIGVRSFFDCLMFEPYDKASGRSLYDEFVKEDSTVRLATRTPVTSIERLPTGKILLGWAQHDDGIVPNVAEYDAVIVTAPSWALQMNTRISGFADQELPQTVSDSLHEAHWESSCKVFVPLKKKYWDTAAYVDGHIPQLIMTDTFIQDLYGYAFTDMKGDEQGVLLASYTWEDDATKLGLYDDKDLVTRCLNEVDRILKRCNNINPVSIFDYVDEDQPVIVHWEKVPFIQGCAKLYRPGAWLETQGLLAYNQEHSAKSGLYFAGEGFSVDGGWTEPALRMAIDAVMHIVVNSGATFKAEHFKFDRDYPRYDTKWNPGA